MPGPVMPVDMAVQLYIAHSPPLRSFLSSYEDCRARNRVNTCFKPLRPCLSTKALEASCLGWQTSKGKAKKKVVFADSKGMSLTAVHVFSPSDCRDSMASPKLQLELAELESATTALRITTVQSRALDFAQPAADYLDFRSRLMKNLVCLENCTLQERALTGTVQVQNLAFEKSVHIRITFDSWNSHQDLECTYMNNVYGRQDTDTFSFAVELPAFVPPQNRVEFCIRYTAGGQTHWDNNDGKNYGLVAAAWKHDNEWTPQKKMQAPKKQGRKEEKDCSWNGLFPQWQSWGCFEPSAPYW